MSEHRCTQAPCKVSYCHCCSHAEKLGRKNKRLLGALESMLAWATMLPLKDGDAKIIAKARDVFAADSVAERRSGHERRRTS